MSWLTPSLILNPEKYTDTYQAFWVLRVEHVFAVPRAVFPSVCCRHAGVVEIGCRPQLWERYHRRRRFQSRRSGRGWAPNDVWSRRWARTERWWWPSEWWRRRRSTPRRSAGGASCLAGFCTTPSQRSDVRQRLTRRWRRTGSRLAPSSSRRRPRRWWSSWRLAADSTWSWLALDDRWQRSAPRWMPWWSERTRSSKSLPLSFSARRTSRRISTGTPTISTHCSATVPRQ